MKFRKNTFLLISLLVITAITMSFYVTSNFINLPPVNKVKGVCWVAGDSIVSSNFNSLFDNNVKWISQTPFAWMRGHDIPNISYDNTRSWWGERDEGIIHTSELAHANGLKVMLKPHIWISRSNGKWRSDIAMNSKIEWEEWFDDYEEMILHYACLAEAAEIDALCIGTELLIPSTKFEGRWRKIIRNIRGVYSGELTYAANFYKEYERIQFWDALDYIGVQAYFPLTKKSNPDLTSLSKAWNKHSSSLEKIAKKYQKKIVFTEVGYKNTIDAAAEPWLWPRQLDADNIIESEDVQARCYEAMFSTLWDEPWFGGIYIWKWFHGNYEYPYKEYRALRRERRAARAKERGFKLLPDIDFTPQGKKAESIMAKYFANN